MLDLQKIIENSQNIKVGINLSDPYLPVLKAREEAEEFVFYMEQYGRAMQGITKIGEPEEERVDTCHYMVTYVDGAEQRVSLKR